MRRPAAVMLGITLAITTTGCWRQAGWDASMSAFDALESERTAANVHTLERRWVIDVGPYATAPIVLGDTVYTTGGDAAGAYRRTDGHARWRTTVDGFGGDTSLGPLTAGQQGITAAYGSGAGGGTATFALADGVHTTTGGFHQIGGPTVFRKDATATYQGWYGSGTLPLLTLTYGSHEGLIGYGGSAPRGPAIVGRHVVIATDDAVLAFSLDGCPPVPVEGIDLCGWEWSAPIAGASTPVGLTADRIAVGGPDGAVTVLDAATGTVVFVAQTGSSAATAPAVAHGVFYAGAADGRLHAFPIDGCAATTCSPLWSGDTGTGAAISHQPAGGADVIYVGTANGRVVAFPRLGCGASSCSPLWTGIVEDGADPGAVEGPVVSDGAVYAGTAHGKLAAFTAD